MPFSAYLKAGLFVVAAAATLFAAAGTIAIPGFWAYLAIFAEPRNDPMHEQNEREDPRLRRSGVCPHTVEEN